MSPRWLHWHLLHLSPGPVTVPAMVALGSLTGCSDCLKLLSDLKVLTPCLEPNPVLPRGNRALLLQVWDVLAGFGMQQLQALRMLSRASKHPSLTPLHIPVCAALDVPVINHVLSVKSQQAKIEP